MNGSGSEVVMAFLLLIVVDGEEKGRAGITPGSTGYTVAGAGAR
jgi:hypothetical protein